MAGRIAIIYEPEEARLVLDRENMPRDVFVASLDVPDSLDDLDVYDLARRLAELMLETLSHK